MIRSGHARRNLAKNTSRKTSTSTDVQPRSRWSMSWEFHQSSRRAEQAWCASVHKVHREYERRTGFGNGRCQKSRNARWPTNGRGSHVAEGFVPLAERLKREHKTTPSGLSLFSFPLQQNPIVLPQPHHILHLARHPACSITVQSALAESR